MQTTNPASLDERYRTLLILWVAILMSMLIFLFMIYLTPIAPTQNPTLTLVLNTVGLVPLALSFLSKGKTLDQSVDSQKPELVQTAYVVAFALSEIPALLGVLDHFVTGSKYWIAGFILTGLGLLLHFPKKKHLMDASYKQF